MLTDLEHIRTRLDTERVNIAVHTVRREQDAITSLDGRRWYRAPWAWMVRQQARFERWIECRSVPLSHWDKAAARDIKGSLDGFEDFQRNLRNPFHPRTLGMLDAVVPFVMERRGIEDGFADVVDVIPPLAERLSRAAIEEFIRAEIARRQAVAADPVLLVRHQPAERANGPADRAGEQWLIVQHQASGVRARFIYHPGRTEGKIFARSYKIESIDPARVEDPDNKAPEWRDYVGIGIGTKLYLRAAEELPNVRWGGISVSQYAEPLRAKLHRNDPWRWRSRTCICAEDWNDLTQQTAAETIHKPAVRED